MGPTAADPNGPYDPQPASPTPGPAEPGQIPKEVPAGPEPIGIPVTDPDRAPAPGGVPPGQPQTPSIPSDPQPRA